MQKLFLSICTILFSVYFGFSQTPVTFNVTMLTIGPSDSLHVVGNFQDPNYDNIADNPDYQNWTPNAASGLMTDINMDLVYSTTLMLLPGRYEFRFVNGNDWPFSETIPQTCTVEVNGNSNRQIMVGSFPVSYNVCYGECADCGQNSVRVRVDMSTVDLDADGIGGELGEDIHPEGVHVNGSFVGWTSFVPLQDWDGNKIWEGLMILNGAEPVQYKYINGPSWDFPNESISGICGDGSGNRGLTISDVNTILPIYCWNSCDPCSQPVPVTFNVDLNSSCVDTSPGVRLMGTATDWANGVLMSDSDGDGVWTITLNLEVGNYEYKFRIGAGGWEAIGNRQLTVVADSPQVLPTACFNSSSPCEATVPPADVTFQVTPGNNIIGPGQVIWVMGDFTTPAWQDGALQLNDNDGDGIWSVTVLDVCPATLIYKFRIGTPGGNNFIEENADFSALGGCGVDNGPFSDNRILNRSNGSPLLTCWTFNTCQACAPVILAGCTIPDACNYNAFATINDGSCVLQGDACNDNNPNTFNDVIQANCACGGGLLSEIGCTDPLACNYDPNATFDNGSCYFNCNPCASSITIWQDDFSSPNNWTIAHDGAFNSDFEIGVDLASTGQYSTPPILSSTASNGYALYDSDSYNNSAGTTYEQAHITTTDPIDLTSFPNVILQFETQYRRYSDEQTYLIISTDGVTWPTLDNPTMDVSAMPGVFKVWEDGELTTSISPGNPVTRSFNISDVAGGFSQVWVRFQFTGIWGYAWYIDDVQIKQQLNISSTLNSARLTYQNTDIEYGRIPVNQLPSTFSASGVFVNDGTQALTGIEVSMRIRESNSNTIIFNDVISNYAQVPSGESVTFNQIVTPTNLNEGLYEAIFNLTSAEDPCVGSLNSNTIVKKFEVTQTLFGLDAISLYPPVSEIFTSLGTSTFTGNADEIMLLNYYELSEVATIYGAEVLLATGTVAGSALMLQVHDTTDVYADNINNPLGSSNIYVVTNLDIANGFVTIPFISPLTLAVNGYYLSVALYSNGNSNDIRIIDDVTVPQPLTASMIYLPSDGVVYSNGNAFCIRLKLAPISLLVGCTSPSACNYDPAATSDDGSCLFQGTACNDGNSATINDVIQSNCSCLGMTTGSDCTASSYNFGNATSGIYPSDSTSLVEGCLNEFYSQAFYLLVPTDAGSIDPSYAGVPISNMVINSFTINGNDISAFGLSSACDISSCLFYAGEQHCMTLFGIPNQAGIFSVSINLTISMTFFGLPVDIPYSFDGYSLTILSNCAANIPGCTNTFACNYNPAATINDGSCILIGSACNDFNSATINDVIQANCQCAGTPIDPGCSGFSVSNAANNPTCAGFANGSISVNTSGNSGPYSYSWSNGSTSSAINNVVAGAYSVTITDATGCAESLSFNLTAPPALSAVTSVSPAACYGDNTGSASVVASGGTGPYSYAWNTSPIQNTAIISNVPAGNYIVNITDAAGCLFSGSATVTQPNQPLLVNATTTSATCSQSDGTASAVVSGNTGAVQYQWSNGQIGATASNLSAGSYSVTVTSGGCSAQTAVNVNNTNAPVINQVNNSPTCFGANNGSINTIITGGTQPYQYLWSNGGSGTSQTGLTAGNYTFIVIDNLGCQSSISVALTQPSPININLTASPTSCLGTPQGSINSTVSGGTQPYQYSWSNGSSSSVINNLVAGEYTLNITDANGCAAQSFATVFNPNGITAFTNTTDVSCPQGSDGSVEVVVSGGQSPFEYAWSNGIAGTPLLENLTAGNYACTITDANGCTFETAATISEPQGNLPDILGLSTVDPFTLQTYSVNQLAGVSYTWIVTGGNLLSGQGTNFIQVQWSDSPIAAVTLLIFYPNGCQSTVDLVVQIGMYVSTINSNARWNAFPNPTTGVLMIELSGTHETISYRMHDISGREIYSGKISEGINKIDLSMMSNGMYTLEVMSAPGQTERMRILKQ